MDFAQPLVGEIELLHHARAVVLHEDVELRKHAEEQGVALGLLQVERQALLVGVPVAEIGRVVRARGDGAARIAEAATRP